MADPKVVRKEEMQQGDVEAQEALEQANPLPDEELPPPDPEGIVEEAMAPVEEEASEEQPAEAGPVPINNLMRIPMTVDRMTEGAIPSAGTPANREREWNAYMMFETLSRAPSTDPLTRLIARRLIGED